MVCTVPFRLRALRAVAAVLFLHIVILGGDVCGVHGRSDMHEMGRGEMSKGVMGEMTHSGTVHHSASHHDSKCPSTGGTCYCHALGSCTITPAIAQMVPVAVHVTSSSVAIPASDMALTSRVPTLEPPPPKA